MNTFLHNKDVVPTPGWRWVWLWLVLGLVMVTTLPVSASEPAKGATGSQEHVDPVKLNTFSQQLVNKIKTGTAEATRFRINVVFYRESLRSLMLASNKTQHEHIGKPLLLKMVRMAALLQSAAECQTGRYIVCPANLLHELARQQRQLNHAFVNVKTKP